MKESPPIASHVLDNVFLNNELENEFLQPKFKKKRGNSSTAFFKFKTPEERRAYWHELEECNLMLEATVAAMRLREKQKPIRNPPWLQDTPYDAYLKDGKLIDR